MLWHPAKRNKASPPAGQTRGLLSRLSCGQRVRSLGIPLCNQPVQAEQNQRAD